MTRPPPNILMFVTDQQRADGIGALGSPGLRTPVLDALVARGVVFDRFYVNSPVCMPNRASLMTCRPPSLAGVRTSGLPLPRDAVTFVDLLRDAGWRTALVGKAHLQPFTGRDLPAVPDAPGRPPVATLAEATRRPAIGPAYGTELPGAWATPDAATPTPYYGFEDAVICTGHADRVGGAYNAWLAARHSDPASLRGPANALPDSRHSLPQAWRTAIPEHLYPTRFVEEETLAWLDRHGRAGPFFLQCSFPDPHHPFTPPGRYWSMYDPDSIALPPSYDATGRRLPPHVAALHRARDAGQRIADTPEAFAATEAEVRSAIALTWGMISMIDAAIGAVLDRVQALGLAGNTIVIFTSDHGELLGDHQLLLKGPFACDSVVRVPMIWAEPGGAGAAPTGKRAAGLGQTMDIGATILDRLGLAPARGMQGRSLLPAMAGQGVRDSVLIEYESPVPLPDTEARTRMRTLVTGDWRLTLYDSVDWGELYNRANDPHELHNLWDDPDHAAKRFALTESMLRAMIAGTETSPMPRYIA